MHAKHTTCLEIAKSAHILFYTDQNIKELLKLLSDEFYCVNDSPIPFPTNKKEIEKAIIAHYASVPHGYEIEFLTEEVREVSPDILFVYLQYKIPQTESIFNSSCHIKIHKNSNESTPSCVIISMHISHIITANVYDHTKMRIREARFLNEITQLMATPTKKNATAYLLCNVTKNSIIHKQLGKTIFQTLATKATAEDTMGNFLTQITNQIQSVTEQKKYHSKLSQQKLLEASTQEEVEFSDTILYDTHKHGLHWYYTTFKIFQHPSNDDVLLFITAHNTTHSTLLHSIAQNIAQKEYDFLCCINAENENYYTINNTRKNAYIKSGGGKKYATILEALARKYVISDDFDKFLVKISIAQIESILTKQSSYSITYPIQNGDGTATTKRSTFSYLDKANSLLLHTQTDITETLRNEQRKSLALSSALSAANEAVNAKTTFLSTMSHELNTPINIIVGMTNIATHSLHAPETIKNCLDKIHTASKALLNIVNHVLNMTAINDKSLSLQYIPFFFSNILNQINTHYRINTHSKHLEYIYTIDANVEEQYIGDPLRLQQIIEQLLSNAIKYTLPGGTIALHIAQIERTNTRACLRITVKDTGCGIKQEFIPSLFEPFSQQHAGIRSNYDGTGLGLAISKHLVQIMGGNIKVSSKENEGSEFIATVWLDCPLQENVTHKQPEARKNTKKVAKSQTFESIMLQAFTNKENANIISVKKQTPLRSNIAAITRTDTLKLDTTLFYGKRVLLVEDHPLNAEIAKLLLTNYDFIVEVAENGQIAVNLFTQKPRLYYDLIIMDIRMPIMDGIVATQIIRSQQDDYAHNIPILAFTANSFEKDVRSYKDAGMNEHLAKPLNPKLLYNTLQKMLAPKE